MLKSWVLLDIRGLMLRAYHGVDGKEKRINEQGVEYIPWEAGFQAFWQRFMIPMLGDSISPLSIIAVWDAGNTYRLGIYPDYKRKRLSAERDPVIGEQLKKLKQHITSSLAYLGVKSMHVPGEEADDGIALLAERLEGNVIIRTVDEDLLQLVSDRVSVWVGDAFHSVAISPLGFKGYPYSMVRVYKALVGDTSDEYVGANGIGEKRFKTMFDLFGEDGMLQIEAGLLANNWKEVEDAWKQTGDKNLGKLLENWSSAVQGMRLASLTPGACYGAYEGKPKRPVWNVRLPNWIKFYDLMVEAKCTFLTNSPQFGGLFPEQFSVEAKDHEMLPRLMEEVMASPIVSWDYETYDPIKHAPFKQAKKKSGGKFVDVLSQKLTGVSINYGAHAQKTVYIPFEHKNAGNFELPWMTWILQCLDQRATFVQNASFELTVSQVNLGHMPKAPMDTSIMAVYVDENESNHLKDMSQSWLRYGQTTYEEVTQGRDMCDLEVGEVLGYGCDDSFVTSHLALLFYIIMRLEGSWDFYVTNEVEPAVNDSLDFIDGQDIDFEKLAKLEKDSKAKLAESRETLQRLLLEHVNNRPQEVVYQGATLLFNEWWAMVATKGFESVEAEQKKREEIWHKAWNSCFYTPSETTVEKPRFQPTKTGLNQVLNYLDPEAPKLQAVSQKAVSDFDMALTDYLGKKSKAPGDSETEQFCTLLYKARKSLKPSARSGSEYGMLEMFCQEVLDEHAPGKTTISGDALNFNADQQMQALLYGKLGLPVRKRSKVDHGSTRDQHGLPGAPATGLKAIAAAFVYDILDEADWRKEVLLAYRQAVLEEQKQSLYFTPYPLWKHPRDGKIHPSFRNCGTVTRRPVGSSPNGLQVAKGPLRALFLGGSYVGDEEPRVVVSADVAGQEAVVTAVESGDAKMLEIFSAVPRKDFHSMTSSGFAHVLLQRAGLPVPGKLTYEQFVEGLHSEDREIIENYKTIRNKYGKGVGFTLLYGGGYRTLAGNLLIDEHLAKEIFFEALNLYSGLEPWQRRTAEFARQHGYVQSVYGTRRHAEPNLWSEESGLKARAERQMCNFLAQGTSADMLKVAKQGIWSRGMRDKYRMRAAGFIYDEVRSSVPVSKAVDYMEELNEVMSITPPTYPIGMQIEFSVGWDWFAQEEIGLFDRAKAEETIRGLLECTP